jgi:hypothetical protein
MSGQWASIRVMQYVLSRRWERITKRHDVTPQKNEVIKIWIFDLGIRFVHDMRFVTHGDLVNNRTGINDYFAARVGLGVLLSVLCVLTEQTLWPFQKLFVDRGKAVISIPTILHQISVPVTLTEEESCWYSDFFSLTVFERVVANLIRKADSNVVLNLLHTK